MENAIKLFNDKKIRVEWDSDKEKWYFSIVDVIAVLTDNDYQTARKYWNKLAQRLREEGNESVTNCHQLKLKAADGKYYKTDVADTEQQRIGTKTSDLLTNTEKLESIYSQKLSSLEELKQSIPQKAFKGELTEVSA